MIILLTGCGQQKYKLELDGFGLSSKNSGYKEGDHIKVTFDMIATDTDYSFYLDCDDVELDRDYYDGTYVMTSRCLLTM